MNPKERAEEKSPADLPWPWSVQTQLNGDGRVGIYFAYKGHSMGRFSGSIENAEWMVLCINAAHACYIPMADGVAQEAGYEDMQAWCTGDFRPRESPDGAS